MKGRESGGKGDEGVGMVAKRKGLGGMRVRNKGKAKSKREGGSGSRKNDGEKKQGGKDKSGALIWGCHVIYVVFNLFLMSDRAFLSVLMASLSAKSFALRTDFNSTSSSASSLLLRSISLSTLLLGSSSMSTMCWSFLWFGLGSLGSSGL